MAIQHVRALQHQRDKFTPIDYAIMEVICTDIGNNDEPCNTSLRTIALRTNRHYNTVDQHIKSLAQSGRLIVTRDGKYSRYNLPSPSPEPTEIVTPIVTSDEDCHTDYVTNEELSHRLSQELSHLEQKLSHRIDEVEKRLSQKIDELSQELSHIITLIDEMSVTKERKEERITTPPIVPHATGNGKNGGGGGGVPLPPKTERDIDAEYRAVVKVYESEIGMITMHSAEEIVKAIAEFNGETVSDAIKIAAENNQRKWAYAKGVLTRWRTQGRGASIGAAVIQHEDGGFNV